MNIRIHCLLICQLIYSVVSAQQPVSQPFAGHVTTGEVGFWCMFKDADSVLLRIADNQNIIAGSKTYYYTDAIRYKKYMPVQDVFSGLRPGTAYSIDYSFDGKSYTRLLQVNTADTGATPQDFSFLAGSCAFISTGFNGAVKPFTSLKIFRHMQQDSADFMLWLGDNLYYIYEQRSLRTQLKRNIKTRLNKKLADFLSSKRHYAIWDDHDYGSNNSGSDFPHKETSLQVFQQFWPNPASDSQTNYSTFREQDAQFFLLDDRYHNEEMQTVLGSAQLEWLKKELLASTTTFKFIAMGMQALNPLSDRECFYQTKEEYQSLIAFIREHKISGIIFLTGDRHHADLLKVEEADMYPLYDFTTSPLTMYPVKISKKSPEFQSPYRVPGTYYPDYNYGKIRIEGPENDRKCILEAYDQEGKRVWEHTIEAKKLQH